MRTTCRFVSLAGAGLAALALAGSALAAYTPRLTISPVVGGPAPAMTIQVRGGPTEDPTAKLSIYVPPGYTANLSQSAGALIGVGSATAVSKALPGVTLPLLGRVQAASPADFAGPPNNECVPGTHQAVWLVILTVAGQEIRLPVYIDASAGAEASFSSYTIVTCLASPADTTRNPTGAQVTGVDLTLNGVFTEPTAAGDARWRAVFTPYTPGTTMPNAPATVETQSVVKVPTAAQVALAGKAAPSARAGFARVTLTGSVTLGGSPVEGAKVQVLQGKTAKKLAPLASAKSSAAGTFTAAASVARAKTATKAYYQASATKAGTDLGAAGCDAASPFAANGIKCVAASSSGFTAWSKVVAVTIPAAAKKK